MKMSSLLVHGLILLLIMSVHCQVGFCRYQISLLLKHYSFNMIRLVVSYATNGLSFLNVHL
jgi:hypothetical protein